MLVFKIASKVPTDGDTSGEEVGLPKQEEGCCNLSRFKTIVGLVKLIASVPQRGIWLASHVLCMFSGFLGTFYLTVLILENGFQTNSAGVDAFSCFLLWFFEIGILVQFVLMVVQVLFVLLGFYIPHRWLGRFHVHLAACTSVASIATATPTVVTIVLCVALVVEIPAYFVHQYHKEQKKGILTEEQHIGQTSPKNTDPQSPTMLGGGKDNSPSNIELSPV